MKNKHRKRERNRVKGLVTAWRAAFAWRHGKKVQKWYNTNGRVIYVDLKDWR